MGYSLADFCAETRSILREHDDHHGREQVRTKLELLLVDPDFCAEWLGREAEARVRQIHEDAELGFCVLVYNMTAPRTSPPHDHGSSWAVYGQAEGHTDMTLWSASEGAIEPVRTFRLTPGQAGLFDVGDIHSIRYTSGSKFVRVTGVNLARVARRVFDPETGKVSVSGEVGTQRDG